jgi:hypothetical protein
LCEIFFVYASEKTGSEKSFEWCAIPPAALGEESDEERARAVFEIPGGRCNTAREWKSFRRL